MADVLIIFMTGLSDTEHIVKGLEAGGDYITKPVNPLELIARLEVHLANARLHHRAKAALDVTGRFLLSVDNSGTICWSMPQADRLLGFEPPTAEENHSPAAIPQGRLPTDAMTWLNALIKADRVEDHQHHTLQTDTRSVQLTYLGRISENEHLLRISEATKPSLEDVLRRSFALTEREAEVLALITDGKPNKKIASILQMSPRTVNTHLDRIFTKIGVDNRTAAAVVAMQKIMAAVRHEE
ncbi:MAG: LuxR C-terminal-related transcriptional regulator [Candidatus Competibacteraceae bacterium]